MQMRLGLYITLAMTLTALRTGAQGIIVPQRLLDSVANPPLERNEALRFECEEIDGIRISEEDAPAIFVFPFRNIGDKPLVVTRVVTSCGCAAAEFDKAPVLPGESGTIRVRYKPTGQAGKLMRSIFVYTNASDRHPAARLRLTGEVMPDGGLQGYPAVMGPLRAKRTTISFGEVSRGETRTERIECVNTGEKPLRLRAAKGLLPAWLSFRTEPEEIAPGATADLAVTVRGRSFPLTGKDRLEQILLIEGLDCRPSQRTLHIRLEIK